MEAPDFMTKYLPLIYILEDCEDDLAAIAKEEDYTRAIGRGWRDTHCKAVLGYTRAIRTDFEMLWQQTAAKAADDVWLGTRLGNLEQELHQFERALKIYVLFQKMIPVPGHGNGSGGSGSFCSASCPRLGGRTWSRF